MSLWAGRNRHQRKEVTAMAKEKDLRELFHDTLRYLFRREEDSFGASQDGKVCQLGAAPRGF
jgi:hypothetical protein